MDFLYSYSYKKWTLHSFTPFAPLFITKRWRGSVVSIVGCGPGDRKFLPILLIKILRYKIFYKNEKLRKGL